MQQTDNAHPQTLDGRAAAAQMRLGAEARAYCAPPEPAALQGITLQSPSGRFTCARQFPDGARQKMQWGLHKKIK
jgi:hypothetical protein